MKQIVKKIQRAAVAVGTLAVAAAPTFAGTVGRLAVTQAITNFSSEMNGPLALGVCTTGLCVSGFDLIRNRELGAVGWSGAVIFAGAGFVMSAPTLVSMIPGAAGFLV